MKEQKKKVIKLLCMVVLLLVIIGLCFPVLFKNLKFGLDLQGGFEVLYKIESIDGSKLTDDMITSTYKTMSKRIDTMGVSEPVISIEGDKVRVQLAGVTDIDAARKILNKAANLTFRDTSDNLLMNSNVLTGGGASVGQDQKGRPAVGLSVKDKDQFYKVTKAVSQMKDNRIVIWLDYEEGTDSFKTEEAKCGTSESSCLSVATVSQGFAGDVIIQGNFTTDEVQTLVDLINSGSLPTKLTEVSSKTVDASFGANSLDKTFIAGVIGIVLIIAFMVLTYHFAGFIAAVGMVIYTFLTCGLFWLVGGVLTLPGIAAVLLGIGMAVDANVINFSRIKDEYRKRNNFQAAYRLGNSNSFGTIIDANTTTLIVAVILFIFGESSIKGFATMLGISIVTTMLIMVFFVRMLLNKFVATGYFDDKLNLFLNITENNLNKQRFLERFDYIKNGKKFVILTIICLLIGCGSLAVNKLNLGIEFKGGSSITINSEKALNEKDIEKDLKDLGYTEASIDKINDNIISMTIEENLTEEKVSETEKYFNEKYDASTDIGVVSNIVKRELIKNAILSLFIAMIGIIIYVSLRFKFSYAVSGVLALFHDTLMVIMIFSLCKLEVSTIFIAAILSIVGYSINNTIVIFDRVKENIKEKNVKNETELREAVNISIQQTVNRAIITTITTLIPVVALIFFGSHEIMNFNLALLIGLIAGGYSSMILAPTIFIQLEKKQIGKKKLKWYEKVDREVEEKKIKGVNS